MIGFDEDDEPPPETPHSRLEHAYIALALAVALMIFMLILIGVLPWWWLVL